MKLKIQCHYENMAIPQKAHASDAGIDLTAYSLEQKNEKVYLFDTGISVSVSEGYYVEVVPRSSIIKTDFIMANSMGIIDPDYRGRLFVALRFVGEGDGLEAAESFLQKRIAQIIIRPLIPCDVEVVESLDDTVRGSGGFGSTGN